MITLNIRSSKFKKCYEIKCGVVIIKIYFGNDSPSQSKKTLTIKPLKMDFKKLYNSPIIVEADNKGSQR